MAETELDRAERRYAQAKARLQALRNREATRKRKQDTRRKVILGGALIDLAARDDAAAAMLERLIRNLARDQDRKAFAAWTAPGKGNSRTEADGDTDKGTRASAAGRPEDRTPGPGTRQEIDFDAIEHAMRTVGQTRPRRGAGPADT